MPDRSFRLIGPSLLSHSNPVGKSGASALPTKVLGCMMLSLCGCVARSVRLRDDKRSRNRNYSTRKGAGLRVISSCPLIACPVLDTGVSLSNQVYSISRPRRDKP